MNAHVYQLTEGPVRRLRAPIGHDAQFAELGHLGRDLLARILFGFLANLRRGKLIDIDLRQCP